MNPAVFSNPTVLQSELSEETFIPEHWDAGRNVNAGYVRGYGIQSGLLIPQIREDAVYAAAMEAAQGRTLVSEHSLLNLYLIIRYSSLRGNIIEFGSYKGGSAIYMAILAKKYRPGCKVFALDTFAGMPPTDPLLDHHVAGDFSDALLTEIQQERDRLKLDNLVLVPGLFDDSFSGIPKFDRNFFISHVDCDVYNSCISALRLSKPYMIKNGYIVFDDPLYSTCLGAMKAVESELVRGEGAHAEQVYPHLVYRV